MNVVFRFTVKEDKVEEFQQIASKLVSKARTDAGCIAYELFQDQNNKQCFAIIEAWESPEAFKAHAEAPHSAELGPLLDTTLEILPPEANFYDRIC